MLRPTLSLALLAALTAAVPASAVAAGPRISSAAALDGDGDGRVDTVRVIFSAKVRGRGAFAVTGKQVVSVEKARGRAVTLRVAEGTDCDLGLRPVVRYRPRGRRGLKSVRGRRVRASRVNMERRDGLPPRLTCAVTGDSDGNGRLDELRLTWSKRVRGGSTGAFSVPGYAIRAVARPQGRFLTLLLSERSASDTDAAPAVTYSRVKQRGVYARATKRRKRRSRGRRGQALPGTYKATRDGAGPVLSAARTADTDADGLVDSLLVSFSEPVRPVPGGLAVAGAVVTGAVGTGNQLTVGVEEGPLATDARPRFSFGDGEVSDVAGNPAAAGEMTAADGAGPTMTAARTGDTNGDGRLDTLTLTFSEPVSHPADSDGAYPLETPGYDLAAVRAASGRTVELALEQGVDPDSGVTPGVRYMRGAAAPVLDGAGNEAVAGTFGATGDGAPPRLIGATTLDVDEDGSLDRVRFRFSEPVVHSLAAGPLSAAGLTVLTPLAAAAGAVDVPVQEAGAANTGLRPLTGYTPPATGGVADAAGNAAPAAAGLQAADGAGPVVVTASTADSDSNQRIDRVDVTMSEPVSYAGDVIPPFALGAEGYAVASVSSASGAGLSINLVEPDDPDTGGAPAVSYGGGGALKDVNGVEAVQRAYTGRTRDTIPPSFVAAETADVDGNGRIDRVDLRYSEDVQGGSSDAPFSVSGRTVAGIEFSGDRARIMIEEAAAPDTDAEPEAGYTVPPDPAERVKDIAEGEGDTPDEAPAQAAVQAADKAGAAVVEAITADVAGPPNGRLDRMSLTFSEPVTHAAESTGPFAIALGSAHAVNAISAASGTALTLDVAEQPDPDGGSLPSVTVADGTKVLDAAGNQAYGGPFAGTEDGVSPVLVAARLGERDDNTDCVAAPPQNGIVDCLAVTWSEPIAHADDPSITVGGGFTPDGAISAQADSTTTDISLVEGPDLDRDSAGTVGYTTGAAVPVLDAAGNEALTTDPAVILFPACIDDFDEPNDTQLLTNPLAGPTFAAYLCAGDEDWYRVQPDASGELHVMMDAQPGQSLRLELWDETTGASLASAASDPSGDQVTLDVSGPLMEEYYWLRVVGTSSIDESEYCVDSSFVPGDSCVGGGGEPI